MINILLVDDHTVVLDGLAGLIGQEPDFKVRGLAKNGEEAVAMFCQMRPNVTLMDLKMPKMGGVEAIQKIREIDSEARIIVLTTYDGDEDIYAAIRAGAKSYLLKDARRDEVFECIRVVAGGRSWISQDIASKLAERIGSDQLTSRETEVLGLIAQGKSNSEVGVVLFISEGTVKAHIKSIFAKLKVLSRTEAIAVAVKRGIVKL